MYDFHAYSILVLSTVREQLRGRSVASRPGAATREEGIARRKQYRVVFSRACLRTSFVLPRVCTLFLSAGPITLHLVRELNTAIFKNNALDIENNQVQ